MFLSVFYILEEKAFGSTVLPEKAMIESACDLRRSSKTFNTFSGPAFETVWWFCFCKPMVHICSTFCDVQLESERRTQC